MPLTLPWKKGFLSGFDRRGESGISTHFRVPSLFQKTVFLVALLLVAGLNTYAANRYSVATGNWSSTATWSASSGGASGASVPVAGDVVFIEGGFTVTVDVATANLGSLSIAAGSTLLANNAVTVAGATTVNGVYIHALNGGTIPTATWNAGSLCNVSGMTTTAPGGINQSFSNFTWSSANTSNIFAGIVGISGDLNVTNGGAGIFRITTNGLTIGGSVFISGTANMAVGSGVSRTLNITGDLNISGGTFSLSTGGGIGTVNLTGDLIVSGGTLTATGAASNFNFVDNGTQTLTTGGTITGAINYSVNSAAILQMASPTTALTGTGSFTLQAGATLGVTSPAGITTSGASGNIQVSGTRTYSTGANYIYNGSAAQSVGNGLTQNTPANLTINNPGNVVSLGAATSISGALNITSGTLDANGQTLTVGGLTTVNGTYLASTSTQSLNGGLTISGGTFTGSSGDVSSTDVTLSSGTLTAPSGAFSVSGNWNKSGGTFTPGSNTVTFTGAGAQTLASGGTAFNNIAHTGAGTLQLTTNALSTGGTFTNSAGTFDANGLTNTVTGSATVSGGTYLASTATQTFNGGLTISGGTFTGSTGSVSSTDVTIGSGTLTAPSGTFSVSGNWLRSGGTFTPGANTVTFTGTGTQTLNSGGASFNNISHTGNGTLQVAGSSLSANGTLANSAGTIDANGQVATISGLTTLAGGSYLASTATQNFIGGLTVSGGTLTGSTGDVNVSDVTLSSGTLTAPSANLNVSGNWTNNGGTFSHNNGTTNFSGSSKSIGGSQLTTFYNLNTSGTASITTAAPVTVTNNLVVASGTSLSIGGFATSVTGTTTVGGGTLNITSSSGAKTFAGLVTLQAGTTWNNSGNSPVTFQGGITRTSGTFTAGTGLYTFDTNSQSLSGTFSIPSVDVSGVSLTNNNNLTVATALSGSGSLTQAVGATLASRGTSSNSSINASNNGNTVIFNGNAQTVNTGTYYNLTINETGGTDATLGGAVGVDGTLTLTTGKTLLGANNLTLGSSATISGGASSATMIVASSSGQIKKTYSGSGSFTFPIGDNTAVYSPVSVNVTAGSFPLDIAANVVKAKHPNNASATNYLNRYWNITPSASATATVTGTYVAGDVNGTEASASAGQLNGTFNQNTNPWTKFGALGGLTMTAPGATLTSGQTSAFTGITGANPTVNITSGGGTICNGGTFNFTTVVTGDPTITYSWSPSAGLSSTTIANPVANPTTTTAYSVTIKDGNGISVTSAPATITVDQPPTTSNAGPDQNVCGTSVTLAGNSPTTGVGSWSFAPGGNPDGLGSIANSSLPNSGFTGTTGKTYVLRWTIASGVCAPSADDVQISFIPSPVVTLSPVNSTICEGNNTTFSVTATGTGLSYQWQEDSGS
ncbi:MAG: hypothetical protein JST14_08775, partial [Bacteroidetes bacterium]|nr:hypothetical protein [Bacteroidota bacterium]